MLFTGRSELAMAVAILGALLVASVAVEAFYWKRLVAPVIILYFGGPVWFAVFWFDYALLNGLGRGLSFP